MTGTPIKTRLDGAVVHIDLTIVALEPVDTDTRVTTLRVVTRGSILAYVRPGQALIHVLVTIFSFEFGRAFASVSLYSVNATASVLAKMAITVVYVDMASGALKACRLWESSHTRNYNSKRVLLLGGIHNRRRLSRGGRGVSQKSTIVVNY